MRSTVLMEAEAHGLLFVSIASSLLCFEAGFNVFQFFNGNARVYRGKLGDVWVCFELVGLLHRFYDLLLVRDG